MIAPWLQDLLYQEWDWRLALRRITGELPSSAGPRAQALCEVARALEHVEPDRRFAIATYREAGPEVDGGRALELAVEAGWWEEVVTLGAAARSAVGSLEALLAEGWALVELGQHARAQRLVPARPMDPYLLALRHELDGATEDALGFWVARGAALESSAAATAYFVAARLSRALGRAQWRQWLLAALRADPGHRWAFALLLDPRWSETPTPVASALEALRLRLAGHDEHGQLALWCEATRSVAMRLWLSQDGHKVRGVARRLLAAALERAYREHASLVPGHLAIWAALDDGAASDDTRVELLPLLVSALEAPLPAHDHVYLAALGADICMRAGSLAAARRYAAVVAERAPAHPAAREFFGHASSVPIGSEAELEGFCAALGRLELEGEGELQIEEMVPLDEGDALGLGPGGSSARISTAAERELSSELATVDELVLGQANGDDAMIAELLAAVDASLIDDAGPAGAPARGHGRRTAVQGSFALAARWDAASGRAPRVVPAARDDASRHPATVIGAAALGLRTPAAAPARPAAAPARPVAAPARVPDRPLAAAPARVPDRPLAAAPVRVPDRPLAAAPARAPVRIPDTPAAAPVRAPDTPAAAPVRAPDTPAAAPVRAPDTPAAAPARAPGLALIPGAAKSALASRTGRAPRVVDELPLAGGLPQVLKEAPQNEHRGAARTVRPADLRLELADHHVAMAVRDLSPSGLFAVTPEKPAIGALLRGELRLVGDDLQEHVFQLEVRVVRRSPLGIGLSFVGQVPGLAALLTG